MKKKTQVSLALTLLSISSALCIRLMKKAGERLGKKSKS